VVEGVARSLDPKLECGAPPKPVVREWMARHLGPAGKLETPRPAWAKSAVHRQCAALLMRGARILDRLDDITRDGLLLLCPRPRRDQASRDAAGALDCGALWSCAAVLLWIALRQ